MKLVGRRVYRIELVDAGPARVHRADARWLDHGGELVADERARRYWSGDMSPEPMAEVLIEGAVRVIERIR